AVAIPLKNPFSLTVACKFALFFVLVLLVVKWVQTHVPGRGVYGVAALAGLTDVDAITLSMAGLARDPAREGNPVAIAAVAVAVATISNTLSKSGLVLALGSSPLKVRMGLCTLAVLVVGAGSLFVHL
ncbi:MAG: DUF4010 domain-containing protein, partial [Tepidisphaeraceae bacterium]